MDEDKKQKDFSAGCQFRLSGCELFSFNPVLLNDANMENDDLPIHSCSWKDEEENEHYGELVDKVLPFGREW